MQDPTGRQRQGFPPRAQCFHLPQGAIPLSDITQQVWEEDEAISLSLVLSPKAGWGPGLGLGTGLTLEQSHVWNILSQHLTPHYNCWAAWGDPALLLASPSPPQAFGLKFLC